MAEPSSGTATTSEVPSGRHASWLELFFDLVFVVAVAALARHLHDAHSVMGLAVFAGLFVPVWWVWRTFAWYGTAFDNDDRVFRFALLAGMIAVAGLAAGVDGAASGDSTLFVVAYAGLLALLAGLYARAGWRVPRVRPIAVRQGVGHGLGALGWFASLLLPEPVRPFVWAVAMLLLVATPIAVLRQPVRAYDPDHIAERYGLFTIIVLGESVVVTVTGLDTGSSVAAVLVALLGFVIAATIWWVYFGRFRSMPARDPVTLFVWAQTHFLVFVGIAAAAVGVAFAVEAAARGDALKLADRLPLGAGLAVYLLAMGVIRTVTRQLDRTVALRFGVAGAVLLLALIGFGLGPLAFVGVSTLLVLAEAATELVSAPPSPGAPP